MIKNYIKMAWRNLLKNRITTLLNITGLSIGISACIIILIFIKYESSFDSHHSKAEYIYRVVQHNKLPDQTLYWNTTAYPLAEALRSDFSEIDMVTQAVGPVGREFSFVNQEKQQIRFEEKDVLFADPFYTKVFDAQWIVGDKNTALEDANSVVLTKSIVEKYFGLDSKNYQQVLGETIVLQGKDPLKITGVIKDFPANSNQRFSILIPYEFFKIKNQYFATNWSGNYQGTTFVVLKDKNTSSLESKISSWKKKYLKPEDDERISYFLQPLIEIHNETLYGSSPEGYILSSNILFNAGIVALFILIIAIVNFVNLLTAQSVSRSKEVGIRKVLGSKRLDLILQFLLENSLVICCTLCLSVAIVSILLDILNGKLSIINLQLALEWSHIVIIVGIGLISIVLGAIYPALVISSYKPIRALKNKFGSRKKNVFNIRRSLIVFQFVVVQLFVIATIIVGIQMNYFKNGNLGFTADTVLIVPTPEFNKIDVFKNSLLEENGISKVSFGSGPPMAVEGLQLGTSFRLPVQAKKEARNAEMKIGDTNYLDFYDLELLAGRNFTTNKEVFDEFIVNEKLLESYSWTPEEAIGKRIQINEGQATIVGVVKDYHNNSFQHEITPCIILNWTYFQNQAFIKIANHNYLAAGTVRTIWEDVFTNSIYKRNFLDDSIAKEYAIEHLVYNGFIIFSIIAISIGCLGLFGLMSFVISRRTKETGIRKVLGATAIQIFSSFSKEFIGLVIFAFCVAVPIVYYFMNLWLEEFTYRINISIWMLASGGLITLIISIITCSFQSIKAALTNPVNVLREQ